MAAFAPAPPGGYHPAPWKAVSGGLSIDVLAELFVPVEFKPGEWFDRLNTVWWFAALTRLVGNPYALVPVIASHPFSEIASMNGEPTFWTVEATRQRLFVEPLTRGLATESLDWIKENWRVGGRLMKQNDDFNVAFQAFDQSIADRSPSVALLTLWGALERLFSPAHQELTFRVSASIAAYLEPPGEGRFALYKAVKKLYGARSKAAHGSGDGDREPFVDTYRLLKRVLVKMIEARHVPSKEELEALLFSPPE